MKRVCYFCEHFMFDPGYPDYSEITPGADWEMRCFRGHFEMEGGKEPREAVTLKVFRENLERAETCRDFSDRGGE